VRQNEKEKGGPRIKIGHFIEKARKSNWICVHIKWAATALFALAAIIEDTSKNRCQPAEP